MKQESFDYDSFLFVDDPAEVCDGDAMVCRVPVRLASKSELMQWFYENLNFLDGFGRNWNALNDFLGYLYGIKSHKVVLYHEDVPLLDNVRDCATYLDVLNDVSKDWRKWPEHEFVVAFSRSCQPTIIALQRSVGT